MFRLRYTPLYLLTLRPLVFVCVELHVCKDSLIRQTVSLMYIIKHFGVRDTKANSTDPNPTTKGGVSKCGV